MTDKPTIHDVHSIIELEYVSDVQLHLEAGWMLLKAPVDDELYWILGWPGEGEGPRPKGPTLADLHDQLAKDVLARVEDELDISTADPELSD